MKLIEFSYKFDDVGNNKINKLVIDSLLLSEFNLIVAQNAVGKSSLVEHLSKFLDFFSSPQSGLRVGFWKFKWKDDDNHIYDYEYNLSLFSSFNITETLKIDDKIYIERINNKAKIYSEEWKDFEDISPPKMSLVSHVRRDAKHYPYLENIINWAERAYSFKFGHIHTPDYIPEINGYESLPSAKGKSFDTIITELKSDSISSIIADFNKLNYEIQLLSIRKQNDSNVLFVKEQDLEHEISHHDLSQGMFRALSLIIYIDFLCEKEKPSLLVIDDICEGLDYERSTQLGKLVFEKLTKNNIQAIVTSNDSFLMNVIDIKYWNVLRREGNTIKALNYQNNREQFDKFRMTGLSNFDFFTSKYAF
jgi:predicted ATPase